MLVDISVGFQFTQEKLQMNLFLQMQHCIKTAQLQQKQLWVYSTEQDS